MTIDTDPLAGDLADIYDPRDPNLRLHQAVVTDVSQAAGPAASKGPRVTVAIGANPIAVANIRYLGPAPLVGDTVWVLGNGADMLILGSIASPVPTGTIMMFGSSTPPKGWLLCDGQSTAGLTRLAAVVGANVPDLRNRFVVAAGGTYTQGQTGGADTVTLTAGEVPAHTHTQPTHTHTGPSHSHTVKVAANSGGTDLQGYPASDVHNAARSTDHVPTTLGFPDLLNAAGSGNTGASGNDATGSTGGGGAHENRPPFYALTFIIKT